MEFENLKKKLSYFFIKIIYFVYLFKKKKTIKVEDTIYIIIFHIYIAPFLPSKKTVTPNYKLQNIKWLSEFLWSLYIYI